jgi:hypothetical protein
MMQQVLALDPARYPRHAIHQGERIWAETNCYTDIWIELLHAWGFDPVAALPFTLGIDCEGDQWTFFKYRLGDLDELYGLAVEELGLWRPLAVHVEEQVARGRPVLVELDSYHLPDTAGTAYQTEHVKSTVAVVAIDLANEELGYFHNQGYYHLRGDDFGQVLRLRGPHDPAWLPPLAEIVKRRGPALEGRDLLQASLRLLRRELARLPAANPFETFKARFAADLDWLANEPLATFHKYSFATLRQFGACYELAATYLQWLRERDVRDLDDPIAVFLDLATRAKTLQFQLARSMSRRKPLDLAPLDDMADAWATATSHLQAAFLDAPVCC